VDRARGRAVFEVSQVIGLVGGAFGTDLESAIALSGLGNLALGIAALERALRFNTSRWSG
jgi:hypothetical protein